MHVVPMYHANGWGVPQWITMVGGRHVMLRKFDPEPGSQMVQRERVTMTMGVPTIFNAIVNCPEVWRYDTSSPAQDAVRRRAGPVRAGRGGRGEARLPAASRATA